MQKKYAIMSGEYSDWELHGYLSNLEDAYKYCARKNSSEGYEKYYPIEMPCFDGALSAGVPFEQYEYRYSVVFDEVSGGWDMRALGVEDVRLIDKSNYPCKIHDSRKSRFLSFPHIRIDFSMPALDFDRAKKVAEDKLYQYLAEENGLQN